jgi:hypothetical protein
MKRLILFVLIMILSSGTSTVIARKPDPGNAPVNSVVLAKTENKLSEEEINRITKRVEEIRLMDKSKLTASEKRELRQELRGYRGRGYRHGGGVYYIGGGTLILIIILILLLAG